MVKKVGREIGWVEGEVESSDAGKVVGSVTEILNSVCMLKSGRMRVRGPDKLRRNDIIDPFREGARDSLRW